MVHLPSFVHLFSLHKTIILCVLNFCSNHFRWRNSFFKKPLRRLPLNADYLENKLGTPIFFFPDLESALNFTSENRGLKKSLKFFPKVGSHLNRVYLRDIKKENKMEFYPTRPPIAINLFN